ncbi:MAG: AraC family transcriptional regulator [Halioglobus sp.]
MVEAGMVRSGPILAIPAVLRSFGVEPHALLAEFGLTESFFADPENTLSTTMAGRLLGRCVERTGCEHFGLLVGQHASASSLGALGYLMQSSSTVEEALTCFSRDLDVQDQGGVVWVETEGSHAILGYTLFEGERESLDQIMACAIAIATNILRSFFGSPWHPDQVLFAFSRPRRVAPYQRFFGVLPNFDMDRTGIVFHSRLLNTPINGADLLLHKLMEERVRELKQISEDNLIEHVRRLLRSMVTSSSCSVEAVAEQVGMHRRAVNRKLAAAGTTLRQMRDEARREVACQLLENTNNSVTDIATMLGYADAASFTRGFQRWTGSTPSRWRKSRRR